MNEKIGFEIMQQMMVADTVAELDEAVRIVNNAYPILRERLSVMELIKNGNNPR